MTWNDYIADTKGRGPRPLLLQALSLIKNKGRAVDLGCGALQDVRAILDIGFRHVVAVDSNKSIDKIARIFPEYGNRLEFEAKEFDKFHFCKNTYDLVNAQYALPFSGPQDFENIWSRVEDSLTSEGVFTGHFFGKEDDWVGRKNIIFHDYEQIKSLFSENVWILHKFVEEKCLRPTASGKDKYWHLFSIIAIRQRGQRKRVR